MRELARVPDVSVYGKVAAILGMLVEIAGRGLALGVHLVLTAPRLHDLRPALQTAVTGRIELRLADPVDSAIDRRRAELIEADTPGRALMVGGHLGQVAVPPPVDAPHLRCRSITPLAPVTVIPDLVSAADLDAEPNWL